MRLELERWRAVHPNWRPGAPLFPKLNDASRPVADTSVREWVRKAYEIVRSDLERQNVPRAETDRWLAGAILHGYRDHWATIMDQLGFGWEVAKQGTATLNLHNHVSFLGDWATAGGAQDEIYAKLNPGVLQAIMEFQRAEDVYRRFSAQAAADLHEALSAIHEEFEDVLPP